MTEKQKELLLDAHLLDKPTFDAELIKLKLIDKKTGLPTKRGIKGCHYFAAEKYAGVWS